MQRARDEVTYQQHVACSDARTFHAHTKSKSRDGVPEFGDVEHVLPHLSRSALNVLSQFQEYTLVQVHVAKSITQSELSKAKGRCRVCKQRDCLPLLYTQGDILLVRRVLKQTCSLVRAAHFVRPSEYSLLQQCWQVGKTVPLVRPHRICRYRGSQTRRQTSFCAQVADMGSKPNSQHQAAPLSSRTGRQKHQD